MRVQRVTVLVATIPLVGFGSNRHSVQHRAVVDSPLVDSGVIVRTLLNEVVPQVEKRKQGACVQIRGGSTRVCLHRNKIQKH